MSVWNQTAWPMFWLWWRPGRTGTRSGPRTVPECWTRWGDFPCERGADQRWRSACLLGQTTNSHTALAGCGSSHQGAPGEHWVQCFWLDESAAPLSAPPLPSRLSFPLPGPPKNAAAELHTPERPKASSVQHEKQMYTGWQVLRTQVVAEMVYLFPKQSRLSASETPGQTLLTCRAAFTHPQQAKLWKPCTVAARIDCKGSSMAAPAGKLKWSSTAVVVVIVWLYFCLFCYSFYYLYCIFYVFIYLFVLPCFTQFPSSGHCNLSGPYCN